jgi:hypothetical protein
VLTRRRGGSGCWCLGWRCSLPDASRGCAGRPIREEVSSVDRGRGKRKEIESVPVSVFFAKAYKPSSSVL